MPTVVEAALAVIDSLRECDNLVDAVNADLRAVYGAEFSPRHKVMPDALMSAVEQLLNAALGGDIASYFLWECQSGGRAVHETDGRIWPLDTIDELRAYVQRAAAEAAP